jgi:hypothetical protein
VTEQVIDDFLVVAGSALVMVDSAARLLGNREKPAAAGWTGEAQDAHPVPPFWRG